MRPELNCCSHLFQLVSEVFYMQIRISLALSEIIQVLRSRLSLLINISLHAKQFLGKINFTFSLVEVRTSESLYLLFESFDVS